MEVIRCILLLAVFPLLIVYGFFVNRIQKNIREKNGDAVLCTIPRLCAAAVLTGICFCGTIYIGERLKHPDIAIPFILLKMLWAVAAYVVAVAVAVRAFHRKGIELKNQK